jgi:hypothetical protein
MRNPLLLRSGFTVIYNVTVTRLQSDGQVVGGHPNELPDLPLCCEPVVKGMLTGKTARISAIRGGSCLQRSFI